jgi:hypothetical protein
MATKFFATSDADTFANPSHSVTFTWDGLGSVAFESDGGAVLLTEGGFPNPNEPYNGFEEGDQGDIPKHSTEILNFISSHPTGRIFHFEVFDDNSVDYTSSTAPVSIDLTKATQHGGFAEGDSLGDIFEVTGSRHDDVIRGSNTSDYPPDTNRIIDGQRNFFFTINKPGENVLNGGDGNDLLEGRGGADTLNGGPGFDLASYESSPAAVTVRLPGQRRPADRPCKRRRCGRRHPFFDRRSHRLEVRRPPDRQRARQPARRGTGRRHPRRSGRD